MARLQHFFVGMFLLCVLASTSMALINRTFVSAQRGLDTNPCTPTSPCRTFSAAIAAAYAGGEVVVLDSGGYGPFTITKAIQISSPPGVYAGLITTASNGITINAAATDVVVIRGLTITGVNPNGTNSSNAAINVQSVGTLHVENCVITRGAYGIVYQPTYAAGQAGFFSVKDTLIRNVVNTGIYLNVIGPGVASVAIDHVRLEEEDIGVYNLPGSTAKATIRDSVIIGNASFGVYNNAPGASGRITIENCAVVNNDFGLITDTVGSSSIFVSNTVISGNQTGLLARWGTITSYGNNRHLGANAFDGSFNGSQALD